MTFSLVEDCASWMLYGYAWTAVQTKKYSMPLRFFVALSGFVSSLLSVLDVTVRQLGADGVDESVIFHLMYGCQDAGKGEYMSLIMKAVVCLLVACALVVAGIAVKPMRSFCTCKDTIISNVGLALLKIKALRTLYARYKLFLKVKEWQGVRPGKHVDTCKGQKLSSRTSIPRGDKKSVFFIIVACLTSICANKTTKSVLGLRRHSGSVPLADIYEHAPTSLLRLDEKQSPDDDSKKPGRHRREKLDDHGIDMAARAVVGAVNNSNTDKNFVWIIAESFERTYLDDSVFPGLVPFMTKLESESVSFIDVKSMYGTTYSISSLVSSQCGVPLVTPGVQFGAVNSMTG